MGGQVGGQVDHEERAVLRVGDVLAAVVDQVCIAGVVSAEALREVVDGDGERCPLSMEMTMAARDSGHGVETQPRAEDVARKNGCWIEVSSVSVGDVPWKQTFK